MDLDSQTQHVDETIRYLRKKIPDAELYELGAILMSAGAYLVSAAIPDMKEQLIPFANIAHQLLTQEEDAQANRTST